MSTHTFSTDDNPALFLEQDDGSGKPARLAAGSQVLVRNADDGTPLDSTTALDLGYLSFTTTDVQGVQVSGDNGATWKGPFWSKEAREAAVKRQVDLLSSSGVLVAGITNPVIDAHLGGDATGLVTDVTARTIKPSAADLTLFVTARGDDSQDGLTIATAKKSIGAALTALAGNPGIVRVGVGTITESAPWGTLPDGQAVIGDSQGTTTVQLAFDGTLATMGNHNLIANLTIDGQGSTYSTSGFYFGGTKGSQHFSSVALVNFDGPCLEFEINAGSGFHADSLTAYRINAASGTGRYAIVMQNTALQNSAVPRRFHVLDGGGQCTIDFGSCNDVHITSSILCDLNWTPNTRGVNIGTSRWLNQAACTIYGANNSIVGNDIYPALTIGSGATAVTVGPGSFNNPGVTDNSGSATQNITHASAGFDPTFTASGGGASLGSGTLVATYSRSGAQIVVDYQLAVESDTTFGSGYLKFGLPYAKVNARAVYCGQGVVAIGSSYYSVQAQITGATNWVRLLPVNSSAPVSGTSPGALAAGSTIRFSVTYQQ